MQPAKRRTCATAANETQLDGSDVPAQVIGCYSVLYQRALDLLGESWDALEWCR